jgi:hypothetical protein
VASIAVLPLLPEKSHYPKLGAYPKYGDFTLMVDSFQTLALSQFMIYYLFFQ